MAVPRDRIGCPEADDGHRSRDHPLARIHWSANRIINAKLLGRALIKQTDCGEHPSPVSHEERL